MVDPRDAKDAPESDGRQLAEGLDHLQNAAKELVAAARSFLDVAEEVIEDDARFSGAAASVADLVSRGLASVSGRDLTGGLLDGLTRPEPAWLRNDPDHPDADDELFGDAYADEPAAAPTTQEGPAQESAQAAAQVLATEDPTSAEDAAAEETAAGETAAEGPAAEEPAAEEPAARNTSPVSASTRTRRVKRISVD